MSGTSSSSDNEDSEDDDDDDVDGDDNAGLDLREVEVVVEVAAARRAPGLVRYSFGYALTEDVTPWEGLLVNFIHSACVVSTEQSFTKRHARFLSLAA